MNVHAQIVGKVRI